MELFRTLKAISGRLDGMYPRPLLRLEHLAVLKTKTKTRRLRGVQRCQQHCLPIATCLFSPHQRFTGLCAEKTRQGERRERSRTNYANWRLACSTLIPGLQNDTARISARACGTDPSWNRRSIICDAGSLSYNLLFPCNLILPMGSGA